ncbi:MAG TPA: ABC transporter permease [Pirellulales bacterium]
MAEHTVDPAPGGKIEPDSNRAGTASAFSATARVASNGGDSRGEPSAVRRATGSAVWSLCYRELIRFVRQRNRIVGAIGQPVLFWVLFGAGLGPTFQLPGIDGDVSYREYFFPGTLALILLFTAIFSTISIIEDRREGFLQSVLVAPISRWSMVLGKVLGGSILATGQGVLFLLLGLLVGLHFSLAGFAAAALFSFVVAFALTSLGFVIAWRMDSTQGFHAIMSVFLLPMWLLSGAFFPAEHGWLNWIMWANPLTYGVAGLRRLLYLGEAAQSVPDWLAVLPSLPMALAVTAIFAIGTFAVGCWIAGQRTTGDLL